ncbi:MAG: CrcB protein [uncultured Sulfurovum sp.]|uniref:Fluoride-specific ion channel FluC n=1 Tax=uncultured Sulfurovum sp. TaxID=269237 RepID=A0A6S6S5I1_9BACT|nr:MAG: CrcB protein [uncultured Sulfurovum sp.]
MQLGLLLAVGIGGFVGAILRFSISNWVNSLSSSSFPFGTLCVNVLGSFVIGFLFLYFQQVNLSVYQKSLLITGLLGALTTFSTFSLDTVLLMQAELYVKALSNVLLNVALSIGATLLGMIIFKRLYL